ncbi:hypothetical protein M501DRAFT_915111, partial [Patellaria atrata CBS 101060]
TPEEQQNIAEFFDFGDAAMPDVSDVVADLGSATTAAVYSCPSHPEGDGIRCLCHGFIDEYRIPQDSLLQLSEDAFDYNFSNWIPRYSKPEHACDYCHSKGLECFIVYEGQTACSSCTALFRPCSFSQTGCEVRPSNALDTLHVVREDACQEIGNLTGIKPLRSLAAKNDEMERKKSGIRFPRAAIKILKDWVEEHYDHPYPNEEEKEELVNKTGLKATQITNWLANARRRGKVRPKRGLSPSARSAAMPIPGSEGKTWDKMNPLERWQHSPPENEPAPLTAIATAVEHFSPPKDDPFQESGELRGLYDSSARSSKGSGSHSLMKAPSITSLETGRSSGSIGSYGSLNSAWSYGSRNSFQSHGSLGSRDKRRRRRTAPKPPRKSDPAESGRIFQCTFCTDRFKSKYDWCRHEKSLHLSMEKWICAPLGETIVCDISGRQKCVYCDTLDPSPEHLEAHNHSACEEKGLEARTFYRKDHLRQHLRLMHGCKMIESMDAWKMETPHIRCRCGFCGQTFDTWSERCDHLAKHFRNGAQMKDWKGCRGFDEHVAMQVQNAIPPYLIGNEAKSPIPFSATNKTTWAHNMTFTKDLEAIIPTNYDWSAQDGQSSSAGLTSSGGFTSPNQPGITTPDTADMVIARSTCWEILTTRLGQFVREQHALGNVVTDEMLQKHARVLLYDSDDEWNQTAADNAEWLQFFKQAHGL